jgi:glycosyltransferase involved in cell wall biosynthesis
MSIGIQTPLVSVVMPINGCNPTFLEKSIESVLKQTLTNFELLVVMDAVGQSVDKPSLNVLEKFKNDERLRIVPNKRKGFVDALNTGISVARGKYIARMDGDDISLPDRLKLQVETIEKEKLDLVGGWAYVIDEQGETVGKLTPPTDAQTIKRMIMLHNPFLHSSVTFKKSILACSGLYNQALFGAEDYDLWLRLISLGYVCVNLPNFVLLLREANNSILRGNRWKTTRANYAKAKVMGLTRWGYHDPLSITCCFAGPFSSIVGPRMALDLKLFLRWFNTKSSNQRTTLGE